MRRQSSTVASSLATMSRKAVGRVAPHNLRRGLEEAARLRRVLSTDWDRSTRVPNRSVVALDP